jgi:hypothetical protein
MGCGYRRGRNRSDETGRATPNNLYAVAAALRKAPMAPGRVA